MTSGEGGELALALQREKKAACIFQWADQMCGRSHIHRTIITESETLKMETDPLGQVARLLLLQLCPPE